MFHPHVIQGSYVIARHHDQGDLKKYMQGHNDEITPERRIMRYKQAAESVAVLHDHGVIHCDLSPRNFLLDNKLNLKISDFGGASLCGAEPSATPETRFLHPHYNWSVPPVFGDDIFSLGSLLYYIETGSSPYGDVPSDEVEKLYGTEQFADTSTLICGTIIVKCWTRQVESAHAVHEALTASETQNTD